MSAMLTADWCPLGRDTYFRKFDLYSMAWQNELRLDNVAVVAAPYGGPLAVVRDRKKFVQVQGSGKPVISLYSAAGQHLASIVWSGSTLVALGWSATEELLCIQDDGSVLRYDIFGTYQHTFSMGKDAKDGHIMDARVFASAGGTGVAVLTAAGHFFLVLSVADPKLRALPALPDMGGTATGSLSAWAVVTEERGARVLVACNRDLYWLSSLETRAESVVKFPEQRGPPLNPTHDQGKSVEKDGEKEILRADCIPFSRRLPGIDRGNYGNAQSERPTYELTHRSSRSSSCA